MTATTRVRRAARSDLGDLIVMGRRFWQSEHYHKFISFDEASLFNALDRLLRAEWAEVLVLTNYADAPVGAIGGAALPNFVSGEIICEEQFWWVDQAFRGYGIKLLKRLERWALEQGARGVIMVEPNKPEVATIYERLGYEPIESRFYKEIS